LGRGIALALAGAGFDIVLGWNGDQGAAGDTAAAVESIQRRTVAVRGDVADPGTAKLLLDTALTLGGADAWVNNAGVSVLAPVVDTDPADMARMVDVNLLGTFHGLQAAASWMSGQKRPGRIVNLASDLGVQAAALLGGYSATKFAVVGLTQAAAVELAPLGITVNAVCPGTAETDMVLAERTSETEVRGVSSADVRQSYLDAIPAGRFCTPADVGDLVAWLCGPSASYITGQAICINGGSVVH
jgi:NAD(P)-dependent dehydrogenase (short-subunit alcohol dehydrogenase family)